MRRFALSFVVVACLAGLLGGAAGARSELFGFAKGTVFLSIRGWGSVKPVGGAVGHRVRRCIQLPECSSVLLPRGRYLTVRAKPYMGWKFVHWVGICKNDKARTCRVDKSRYPACRYGTGGPPVTPPPPQPPPCRGPRPWLTAKFVPVAPGLTRKNPIPIGTAHKIGNGYTWRVNSTQPNVQLSSTPAAGEEYFDADVTLAYTGPGASIPVDHIDLNAVARDAQLYNGDHGGGCPASDLQPRLDILDPVASGQSVTGHVCWTVATGDAANLEMYFGSGSLNFLPVTTWFALH